MTVYLTPDTDIRKGINGAFLRITLYCETYDCLFESLLARLGGGLLKT